MRRATAWLYLTAFASGLVSLGVELAASSLLRPYFGTANLVWAAIIGLILLYLTAGYFLGGWWADRFPYPSVLYQIVAWAAFLIGLIPFVARPVLLLASRGFANFDAALLGGSFLAVLVLFSAPVTLLGCVSPFIVRLALESMERAGQTAGRVYAISTAGSFIGAFLPDLVLVPTIGTRNTFAALSLFLLVIAWAGLRITHPRRAWAYLWMPAVITALALWLRGHPVKAAGDTLYEGESAYNYIQIVERDGCRQLLLNEGEGVHSIYCPDRIRVGGPWDYFLIAPFFNPPPYTPDRVRHIAVIGLAAGTIARQSTHAYGPIPIDGVEIDPDIVQAGRTYFGMDFPHLNIIVADGRFFLARSPRRYTLVGVDAYRLPYIPSHLTTVEFFALVREHLTEDGVAAINVGHTPTDYRLVEAMVATLSQVFPSVHVIDVPGSFNAIVVATVQPTEARYLLANILTLQDHPLLFETAVEAAQHLRTVRAGTTVFTDDRAPIEAMTNALIINYLLRRE